MAIGGVLSEAWELYRRFFARFVLVAAPVFLVLGLLEAIGNASSDEAAASVLWGLIGVVVGIIGTFWVQGALVEAVRDVRDGRADLTVGELYDRVRGRLPALIVAGLLAGLGVLVGLILLIIPGLYLLTRWSMIVPVIVLEGRSAGDSFGRSWEIVRGNAWRVFWLIVITLFVAALASGILQALLLFLPDFLSTWLGSALANSIVVPFVASAWTVAYYRLVGEEPAPQPTTAVPA
jgi:hypothetical protein